MIFYLPSYLLGILLLILSVVMLIPAVIIGGEGFQDINTSFMVGAILTAFIGGIILISLRGKNLEYGSPGRGVLSLLLIWVVLPLFAAIPIKLTYFDLSIFAAYYDAVSAFTTTGSSTIRHLSEYSRPMIIWYALLQWLGGLMTVIMASFFLDPLAMYGSKDINFRFRLFNRKDKLIEALVIMFPIYLLLTLICFIMLYFTNMPTFDAVIFSLTSISTGGFSPTGGSLNQYGNNLYIKLILLVFMIIGATSFLLHRQSLLAAKPLMHIKNHESRDLVVVGLIIGLIFSSIYLIKFDEAPIITSIIDGVFSSFSLLTTTSYIAADNVSDIIPVIGAFCLIALGGATFSTAGGVKLARARLLFKLSDLELKKLIYPNSITTIKIAGQNVSSPLFGIVWLYFVVFVLLSATFTIGLTLLGVNFEISLLAIFSALSNSGPTLDIYAITPHNISIYSTFEDGELGLLSICMILGRVEILILLNMLNKAFWEKA